MLYRNVSPSSEALVHGNNDCVSGNILGDVGDGGVLYVNNDNDVHEYNDSLSGNILGDVGDCGNGMDNIAVAPLIVDHIE